MEAAMLDPENQVLQQRMSALESQNQELQAENKLLRQKVDLSLRRLFGSSSENIPDQQLQLLMAGLAFFDRRFVAIFHNIAKNYLHSFIAADTTAQISPLWQFGLC